MDKVLICGASGMVGRNLSEAVPSGYKVLLPDKSELNLLDYEQTYNYIRIKKPDIIIHAAGIVGGIQANISNPVKFLIENSDIGRNIVWAAHKNQIPNFLNIGSSCMYPADAVNPLKEEMLLSGKLEPTNEGYAIAKILTQRLCSYLNSENSGYSYKTVIPCNLYGKHDKFDLEFSHMIPAVIRKIHEAKIGNISNVEIWGDGNARREFMYAGDFAEIVWNLLSDFKKIPELLNVGLGKDYTINEYYHIISKVIGYNSEFYHNLEKPVGMKQKLVDVSKLKNLGIFAKTSLEKGIAETYKYYLTTL
ncbi:MAG: GDP-fucose synthetase [Bacteroidetes bacterium GWF2_38_335]|nr:MAG: GDP-fucose synthetase [Bacteroidetes bacterium GWF2_38_335]OFY76943.1 MAG: GDP-fucose synthetase [Bacteroidetes bacterium RIFOXYA12_FULL_38_20]HBS86795.1 GDP-fucose synthetase [Bacteroidales bacterium]